MTAKKLPTKVIAEDRKLQAAGPALGELRWHWTKNPGNPDRVTQRQYAVAVEVNERGIGYYVRGYLRFLEAQENKEHLEFFEACERAAASKTTEAIVEAVANEEETSFVNARQRRKETVKKTRAKAEARAKRKGTTVAEEAPAAAADVVGAQKAKKAEREAKASRLHLRFGEADSKIERAKDELRDVRSMLRDFDFETEDLTELGAGLVGLRSILNDCLGLTGSLDLDAEFQEMGR